MKKSIENKKPTLTDGRSKYFAYTVVVLATLFLVRMLTTVSASTDAPQQTLSPLAGTLIISEFRLRGPNGINDEFIEIYNNTGAGHMVSAASGTGYAIAASDGVVRCSIPNGTLIPARGHYLCANSVGYTLSTYPAGSGTTATANATYITGIGDNVGIALFNNNTGGASFSLANRFDAVGSTTEANTIYKEGTGYPAIGAFSIDYSFTRKIDLATGFPADADNNSVDFLFADTSGTGAGAGQRLGAPGPENLSSPLFLGGSTFAALPIDATTAVSMPPNRVRNFTSDPGNNSILGTIDFRRRFVNNTGGNITRLRFRILDVSTFLSTVADLRPRNTGAVVVAGINDAATCAATGAPATPPCTVTIQGTTLEQPPSQINGGGFNSSMSAGTVTLATPLAPGSSINLQFLMGIQANGAYHLLFELEALPGGGAMFEMSGNTSGITNASDSLSRIADFDGEGKTDLSVFRPSTGVWFLNRSTAGATGVTWGISTDKIVPSDYDGDGRTDVAVFRPSEGRWYIFNSATSTFTSSLWGTSTDIPAPGDYDGDGKADVSIFRPTDGNWWLNRTTAGTTTIPYGQTGDIPVVGDYDRDAKADIAVFRPSNGLWSIHLSSGGDTGFQFGLSTDKVAQADYDGDGKTDIAVYRPSTGQWFIANSASGTFPVTAFGAATDIPTPGDYDGDGKADIAIFRPSDGNWWLKRSSAGQIVQQFGQNGDRPVPSAYGN